LILLVVLVATTTHAADDSVDAIPAQIPDSSISYAITVSLDPATRELDGHETITWTNTLDETVTSLPMHLYLNAFSSEGSTWNHDTRDSRFQIDSILERFDDPWGWTEPKSIRQGGEELEWHAIAPDDGNLLDRTLIEVTLAQNVAPGETLTLDVDWTSRMPAAAARTGGHGRFFFVAQWFPKIAGVQPEGKFNRHQFFGITEFFANFANFDVSIGVPADWGIASTGKGALERSDDGTDWYRYQQQGVVDFAFVTGADMEDAVTEHELVTGGKVDIHVFQPKGFAHQVPRWTEAVATSLDVMSKRVLPYPYATATVVLPPRSGLRTLGMEYPTFFTGMPGGEIWDNPIIEPVRINETVIAHEFAHQYFQGIVATNEFEDAFMDEGMTEYWGVEIMRDTWGEDSGNGHVFGRALSLNVRRVQARPATSTVPPVWAGPSFLLRGYNRGTLFYSRPAATFQTAARLFGQQLVDEVFARYAQRWSFGHPRVEDFWAIAEEVGGSELAAMYREAYLQPGKPDYRAVRITSDSYTPPRGYIYSEGEPVHVDSDWDGDPLLGLTPAAHDPDGLITVEIVDPGFTRQTRTMGRIEHREIQPVQGEASKDYEAEADVFFVSGARIEGPDWDHLPVTVELRFADGAIIRDAWDGKGLFREYKIVRSAPLNAVIVDPERNIWLDTVPVNNGLSREPAGEIVDDWSRWLGSVFQLVAEGAASWL
jgi:hypothetical protein